MTDSQEPSGATHAAPPRKLRTVILSAVAGVVAVALVLTAVMWLASGSDDSPQAGTKPPAQAQDVDLASLKESSTYTSFEKAPEDEHPSKANDGKVVHPTKDVAIHEAPDGEAIAKIGPKQLGDTWLPIIDKRDGWVQVLLPSKPNGSTGWLRDVNLKHSYTPYVIRVHLKSMKLDLEFDGKQKGSWDIGIGKPDTPTPLGRTFLLGSFVDPKQDYSPVILPLGAHSPTLDTFGGGPGTVAIHTWPTTDVLGTQSSDGCIRVPKDALEQLTQVPLGTLVLVDEE